MLIHNPVDSVYVVFGRIPRPSEDSLMIRISLPDDEIRQLEGLLQTTTDATFRHRIQIVLMAHRGRRTRISRPTPAPLHAPSNAGSTPI